MEILSYQESHCGDIKSGQQMKKKGLQYFSQTVDVLLETKTSMCRVVPQAVQDGTQLIRHCLQWTPKGLTTIITLEYSKNNTFYRKS